MQNGSLGDRGAYFVENYMEKLFYFCLRKTGDSDRAADLTQEPAKVTLAGLLHILNACNPNRIGEGNLLGVVGANGDTVEVTGLNGNVTL